MNEVHWHQIKRNLKISNRATDLHSTSRNWYTDVEPLHSGFVTESMSNIKSGKNVFVDKQFNFFKRRSRNNMQIGIKTACVGFKIYGLCLEHSLYNFSFAWKVTKIIKLKKKPSLTDSSSIVYRFYETLPEDRRRYVVFMDSFFSNVKFFTALKVLSIGEVRIAKLGSRFPV